RSVPALRRPPAAPLALPRAAPVRLPLGPGSPVAAALADGRDPRRVLVRRATPVIFDTPPGVPPVRPRTAPRTLKSRNPERRMTHDEAADSSPETPRSSDVRSLASTPDGAPEDPEPASSHETPPSAAGPREA